MNTFAVLKTENYDEVIEAGEHVEILRIDGVKVIVKKVETKKC